MGKLLKLRAKLFDTLVEPLLAVHRCLPQLQAAQAGAYAVPSFCAWNAESLEVILRIAHDLHAPVIVMNGPGEFPLLGAPVHPLLRAAGVDHVTQHAIGERPSLDVLERLAVLEPANPRIARDLSSLRQRVVGLN